MAMIFPNDLQLGPHSYSGCLGALCRLAVALGFAAAFLAAALARALARVLGLALLLAEAFGRVGLAAGKFWRWALFLVAQEKISEGNHVVKLLNNYVFPSYCNSPCY